jgi:hypothetical protein
VCVAHNTRWTARMPAFLLTFIFVFVLKKFTPGTWTPLCLPLYSPDANVFAYICYLHKHGAPDVFLFLFLFF